MATKITNIIESKLTSDTSDLDKGLKQAEKQSEKTAEGIKEVEKSADKLEGKIKVLGGAINLLGGSVELLAGGLALSGAVTDEQAERFEAAAVGAIAFADGGKRVLEGVKELREGMQLLGNSTKITTMITKGFGIAMKVAMGPVGIAIAAIGAITAAIVLLKDKFEVVGKVASWFSNIIGKVAQAIGLGKTEAEKFQEAQAGLAEDLDYQTKLLKAQGASLEDVAKKERELLVAKRNSLKQGTEEYKKAQQEINIFDAQQETDRKAREEKAAEERKAKWKAANDEYLALQKSLATESQNLAADTEDKKLALEYERGLKEIDALKVSQEKKDQLRLQAEANYNVKLSELQEAQRLEQEAKDKEAAEKREALRQTNVDRELELLSLQAITLEEQRDAQLAALQEQYEREYDLAVKNGEDLAALDALYGEKAKKINDDTNKAIEEQDKAAQKVKEDLINGSIDNIQGALSALFGESKAVARANVLVDAGQAAIGILKNSQTTGPLAIAYQISQFALLAATTANSLKQINSAQPGGGGSGAPSTPKPSQPGGGGFPVTGTRGINPSYLAGGFLAPQTTGTGTEPVRAYVVTGDVTNGQQAESQIRRRRSLGG